MVLQAAPFLIAVCIAIAADTPVSLSRPDGGLIALFVAVSTILASACVSVGLGTWLLTMARRKSWTPAQLRMGLLRTTFVLCFFNLAAFAALTHLGGWPDFVRYGLGLRKMIVAERFVIVAPFILMDVLGWLGMFPVARNCRLIMTSRGWHYYIVMRARETYGAVLPAAIIFWAGNDIARLLVGDLTKQPWVQMVVLAVLGTVIVLISPALLKLSFPTRSMPPGPLRTRLEGVARNLKFRFSDFLIWETEGSVFNARLTGVLPGYRYVLFTDALITHLDDDEIAAIFGHELGHVYHGHYTVLALFCLGSLAILALVAQGIDGVFRVIQGGSNTSSVIDITKLVLMLAAVGVYFRLAFGAVSRTLERQADVYGCKSVSCVTENCIHSTGWPRLASSPGLGPNICRMGIKTYSDALRTVAVENQVDLEKPSWRHGSIGSRMRFLANLDSHPENEWRFQDGVIRVRLLVGMSFLLLFVFALVTGAFEYLRSI